MNFQQESIEEDSYDDETIENLIALGVLSPDHKKKRDALKDIYNNKDSVVIKNFDKDSAITNILTKADPGDNEGGCSKTERQLNFERTGSVSNVEALALQKVMEIEDNTDIDWLNELDLDPSEKQFLEFMIEANKLNEKIEQDRLRQKQIIAKSKQILSQDDIRKLNAIMEGDLDGSFLDENDLTSSCEGGFHTDDNCPEISANDFDNDDDDDISTQSVENVKLELASDDSDDEDELPIFKSSHNNTRSMMTTPNKLSNHKNEMTYSTAQNEPFSFVTSSSNIKNHKTSDEKYKFLAFNTPIMDVACLSCNSSTCKHGGYCVDMTTLKEIRTLRESFWGTRCDPYPTSKDRFMNIYKELKNYYNPSNCEFQFFINSGFQSKGIADNGGKRQVCESAFLILLGLSCSPNASDAPFQWKKAIKMLKSDMSLEAMKEDRESKSEPRNLKYGHAIAYIIYITKIYCDTSPLLNKSDILVLPYDDEISLFREYEYHSECNNDHPDTIAGETTFRNAFRSMTNIRTMGCKGSFPTCEICNNTSDLLKDPSKRWKKEERDMILKFRRVHLDQQAAARQHLTDLKVQCREMNRDGQPIMALIYPDGMTARRGNTPKIGHLRHSSQDNHIANRTIGVEVYCGPISGTFLYHVDQFVSGGGNLSVEVTRQAIQDLAKLLKDKHNLKSPRILNLQYDNCGENKCKVMMAYTSLLVEKCYFDEININFLIVGHTHSSIDQYFSVLSSAIFRTHYIWSPLALHYLYDICHSKVASKNKKKTFDNKESESGYHDRNNNEVKPSKTKAPLVQRQLRAIYDYTEALSPFINKDISFFRVPHKFRFRRIPCGRAPMQYMLFSHHKEWLPPQPDNDIESSLEAEANLVTEIRIPEFSVIDGVDTLADAVGIPKDTTSNQLNSDARLFKRNSIFNSVLPSLRAVEIRALDQQNQRMNDEADGQSSQRRYVTQSNKFSNIEQYLKRHCSKQKGFILWLDYSKTVSGRPNLEDVKPRLINPATFFPHWFPEYNSTNQLQAQNLAEPSIDTEDNNTNNDANETEIVGHTMENEDNEEEIEVIIEHQSDSSAAVVTVRNEEDNSKNDKNDKKANKDVAIAASEMRSFLEKAKQVASLAKSIIERVNSGTLTVLPINKFDYDVNFFTQSINQIEFDYFTSRSDARSVLSIINEGIKRETSLPFDWISLPVLAEEDQTLILQLRRETEERMIAMCNKFLVREGHGISDGVEIISRGFGDSIFKAAEVRKVKNQALKAANKINKDNKKAKEKLDKEELKKKQREQLALEKATKLVNNKNKRNIDELVVEEQTVPTEISAAILDVTGKILNKNDCCPINECSNNVETLCDQYSEQCQYHFCSIHSDHRSHSLQLFKTNFMRVEINDEIGIQNKEGSNRIVVDGHIVAQQDNSSTMSEVTNILLNKDESRLKEVFLSTMNNEKAKPEDKQDILGRVVMELKAYSHSKYNYFKLLEVFEINLPDMSDFDANSMKKEQTREKFLKTFLTIYLQKDNIK